MFQLQQNCNKAMYFIIIIGPRKFLHVFLQRTFVLILLIIMSLPLQIESLCKKNKNHRIVHVGFNCANLSDNIMIYLLLHFCCVIWVLQVWSEVIAIWRYLLSNSMNSPHKITHLTILGFVRWKSWIAFI